MVEVVQVILHTRQVVGAELEQMQLKVLVMVVLEFSLVLMA
jgi:hypothetical protein